MDELKTCRLCGSGFRKMSRTVKIFLVLFIYIAQGKEVPNILIHPFFLLPATKLGQGNVFTGVCDSVHRGGRCLPQCMLAYHHHHHPGSRHPPPHRACWEIRSTRGRYASYWNAVLSFNFSSIHFCFM